jgi:hypothetical protein
MNAQQAKPSYFDAGRTGLFPGSCLSRGRHPESPAAQALLPNPTWRCRCGRRLPSSRRVLLDPQAEMRRQTRPPPFMKTIPLKPNQPSFSWWLRNVTTSNGKRVITLWRSTGTDPKQPRRTQSPRSTAPKQSVKLRVRFAREAPSATVQITARSQGGASLAGAIDPSLSAPPPAPPAARPTLRAPRPHLRPRPGTT